jgi:hypothetical protein
MRRALALAVAAAAALASPSTSAQPARDPATARVVFAEAKALLEQGNWAGACPKFQASFDLNPVVSPLLNVARCHEHEGKLTLAWDDYQRALTLNRDTDGAARRAELEEFTKKQIEALEPRLSKLRVVIANPPPGLRVRRDGVDVPGTALGTALPVDPGAHDVEASAPGYATAHVSVAAKEGGAAEATISLVLEAPAHVVAVPTATASAPTRDVPAPAPAATPSRWPWIVGGAGVVLLGVAAGFGVDALSASSKIDGCKATPACGPADGLTQADVTSLNGRKDTGRVLFGVLGATGGIAVGVAVVGLAKRGQPSSSSASSSSAGSLRFTAASARGAGTLGAAINF